MGESDCVVNCIYCPGLACSFIGVLFIFQPILGAQGIEVSEAFYIKYAEMGSHDVLEN